MKILLINHFPLEGSGSGIYTRNLAEELVNFGHEVMVIYPEHYKTRYEKFESMPIVFKSDQYNKADDVDVPFDFPCFTSHPRSVNTFYDLTDDEIAVYIDAFKKATQEAVKTFKPDMIHAQHLWLTPYVASFFNIPYVITAHGTDLKGFLKDERYHPYALEGAEKAQKVITISKQVDQDVEALLKVPKTKRSLILNGYNPELFKMKALDPKDILGKYGIDYNGEKIVFFAGKLAHFKGVDVLLDATQLNEKALEGRIVTVIAGNGELYETLIHQKNNLGLQNTHFLGHIYQEALTDLYNIAHVSCVPSRTEPFGLVAIEALACGAPVVGTNQGGLPDFITSEVGALVPVEDSVALSDGILKMLKNNSHREMADVCHNYAELNFSRHISIKKVAEMYREILIK
ncbi:glycosyltransferase family 4 protein [Fusibacter ferrireducens]|uniref:Glycosyltransferase family 4 protein n=1 Tax=Fusibacter ferrireducens TaxID=2785058 RepID=A0ABS0A0I0_9FIRM|nr:glycosyltransferase family 4 protein [Fusibacter ferrireducens]MBF4695655.1 glycosyltransferase family 4 protein [Fusibacter ferrireducens]